MTTKHFDHHIHSNFSSDTEPGYSFGQIIDRSISIGLSGISITDHLDPLWPDDEDPSDLDVRAYQAALTETENLCEGRIIFSKGIELGFLPGEALDINMEVVSNYPYDFVIGSVHYSEKLPVHYPAFHEGRTIREVLNEYYTILLESIRVYKNYDVLGHINAIDRQTCELPSDSLSMPYVDEILKVAIADGKGIEINTSSYGKYGNLKDHGTPTVSMIKRYKELGGEIITIGSDAHRISEIGAFIDKGEELLRSLGFKYAAFFKSRRPDFYNL